MKRTCDDYFSDSDDELDQALVRSLDRTEQLGGALGPLFRFNLARIGPRRRWRNVADHQQFHATLHQERDPVPRDNIGVHLTEALYEAIRAQIVPNAGPRDQLHFAIQAHGFAHAFRSINLEVGAFLERSQYLDELLDRLAGKLNSNEQFDPQRGLQVDVIVIRMPPPERGNGKRLEVGRRSMKLDNQRKRSIVTIKNKDDLCCARAIVTMRAWCHRNDPGPMGKNNWDTLRQGRPRQGVQARKLHRLAGVPEGPCAWEELDAFQRVLSPHYQLKVVCRSKPFFMIYCGPDAPHQIMLLKSDHHYEGCNSFSGFMNKSYWCHLCDRGFDHRTKDEHACEGRTCRACHRDVRQPCPDYNRSSSPSLLCSACFCHFYGPNCLQHHRDTGQCQKFKKCPKCHAHYKVEKKHPHRCGYDDCYSCHNTVDIATHRCYIQPPFEPPPRQPTGDDEGEPRETPPPQMVYADIEAMLIEDRGFTAQLLCYRHQDQSEITTLQGDDCIERFLWHMDDLAHPASGDVEEQPLIIVFHNLKGFDGLFLLRQLYQGQRTVKEQLTIGAKVLSFESGPLTFKDSLCFLPMPLSSFPATFGLTELKKGFFPHAFNLPANQDYVGPIPELHYFDPDGMSAKTKTALETWHADQVRRNVVYDFQKELEEYCQSDVDILQRGCEAFCEEFESHAGFNPFVECMTIASACHLYWRKTHLPLDTIAVQPPKGWRGARVNQSMVALQWLYYQESLLPKEGAAADRIKHVRNGGEQKLRVDDKYVFVDGFDPTTNTVYEFHGCLWHGCRQCCQTQRWKKYDANPDRSLDELYTATLHKTRRLQAAGYTVLEQWECQWTRRLKQDPTVRAFVNQLELVSPLESREAFFGGRTGAVALYAKAEPGEEIHYVDVTSLYPWVNKTQVYTVGHPTIITQPANQTLSDYFGIATVDILPPPELFHPVLLVRSGGKLTFPLCSACVKEEQSKPLLERSAVCTHTPTQRRLRGTWCTPELEKAVEKGYTLLKIHEVFHFPHKRHGLFQPYVDTWLKLKQESAGWPRWCTTQADKDRYVQQYQEREGIRLEHVEKNPGRKQVAKLMLNSFWGKFGEKPNKPKTVQIKDPHELYKLLYDPAVELSTLRICNEDVLEAVYKQSSDNANPSVKSNIFIAAFTTCWARLKLYSYLDTLKKQVLYYDTDSVIYHWSPGQPKIATGDFLGEMTDELEGDVIEEFVSGGAKNYGYKTRGGKYECKVRGFTLNVRGSQALNYHTMKNNILAELEDPAEEQRVIPVTNPNHFKRNTTHKTIKLVEQVKHYRLVFDKRVIDVARKVSYPFGYWSSPP